MGIKDWRFGPSEGLWIGGTRWPESALLGDQPNLVLQPGILLSEAQIAGLFCEHKRLFGFLFAIPETDPLVQLGKSYYGSSLPGRIDDTAATSLDEVLRLQSQLRELGLDIDPVHYADFAEAYIPIEPSLAWAYARTRKLELYESFDDRRKSFTLCPPEYVGIADWPDAEEYLAQGWLSLAGGGASSATPVSLPPDRWTSALVVENSD